MKYSSTSLHSYALLLYNIYIHYYTNNIKYIVVIYGLNRYRAKTLYYILSVN
jgi:hypothetical protein